jgi:flagellar hook-basal body complex protein FliE
MSVWVEFQTSFCRNHRVLGAAENGGGLDFGAVLKNAVQSVDQMNSNAGAQVNNLLQSGTAT